MEDNERVLNVSIQKLDNSTRRFESFVSIGVFVFPGRLFLAGAKVWPKGRPMPVKGQKSGFNVFRLFLNEAIAVARKKGLKEIVLRVDEDRIQRYYEELGFKFDEKAFGKGKSRLGRFFLK
ncbi:MAG: hypothetical protein PHD95_03605 [Candidatus ainarchaeum sp.]|nr:hypothetical protein [Candidatus ainarchaeum sp.]